MAKIKTIYGTFDGTNYSISESGAIFVVSPLDDYIWIGDEAYDFTTLAPVFDLENRGIRPFGGERGSFPVSRAVFNNKTTAFAPTLSGEANRWAYGDNQSEWSDNGFLSSLDKSGRINRGSVSKVADSSGQDIFFLTGNSKDTLRAVVMCEDNLYTPSQATNVNPTEFPDNDWLNELPARGFTADAPNPNSSVVNGDDKRQHSILHVDTTNKVIYYRASGLRSYSSNRDDGNYPNQKTTHRVRMASIMKSTYQTQGDNGSISLSEPSQVQMTYGGLMHYGLSTPVFYAGLNNAGNPCFLMFIENSTFRSIDDEGFDHTDLITPTAYRSKPNDGRIYFYEYDVGTDTVTLHADLRGDEGFVGDVGQATTLANQYFSDYTPTHFEPSPINGETDIYYAYAPAFDSATKTLRFFLLTWDKANNTLGAELVEPTMDVGDAISDYLTYGTQGDTDRHQDLRLNCVLTKSGATYALSVFYSHTTRASLALMADQTNRNLVSFTIDATDFSSLTYHSSMAFPVLSWVSQNPDHTRLLTISSDECAVYDWSNGWSKTASESGYFISFTHDSQGRYWGVSVDDLDYPNKADFGFLTGSFKRVALGIHVISASLPNLASVSWQDSGSFTYTGSNLSKNLVVNAYDENGARVAKSVDLLITGNATFTTNGTKSLTTTTSADGDTLVQVTISGAGQVSVSASFAL